MLKACILDEQSLYPEDLDWQQLDSAVAALTRYPKTSPEAVVERLQGQDIAIVNKVVLDASVLAKLPNLKHIVVAATGTNNIDIEAAKNHGITVQNCRAYGVSSVAQHTLMLMLALGTRVFDYREAVRDGRWTRSDFFCLLDFPVIDFAGKTFGIVGFGDLGQAVARLAEAFGMRVLVAARSDLDTRDGRMKLHDLLPQIDVLSLHCPLTPQTQGLISARELALMKPSALLINCARGGVVNEGDLLSALANDGIAGAATDVLTQEPPAANHPMLAYERNNLIITPHCAWASQQARQTIVDQLVQNIQSLSSDAPRALLT